MRSVRIDFTGEKPRLDFDYVVAGFLATVQNSLVNLGTELGSDRLYPSRGTNLLQDAVSGKMINQRTAEHSANFAALKTLTFIQETGDQESDNRLQSLQARANLRSGFRVEVGIRATSAGGQTIGELANI